MTPDDLQTAINLDERASESTRLLLAGLALVADLAIDSSYRLGAVTGAVNAATRPQHGKRVLQ